MVIARQIILLKCFVIIFCYPTCSCFTMKLKGGNLFLQFFVMLSSHNIKQHLKSVNYYFIMNMIFIIYL